MRNALSILALLAIAGWICGAASAQSESLYEQEGSATDGYPTIDATGQGPADPGTANTTNWKYQYGSGSYSAIYGSSGWVENTEVETGDSVIDIECDIELYYSETFSNNKIYFHIGDPFGATTDDKTAYVDGTITYNNGMYIGISFDGTSKTEADMLKDGDDFTGEVQDAMVGTTDAWGRDISDQAFNVKFSLSWDAGATYHAPVSYGDGSHNTIHDTLWWLVDEGNIGSYTLKYKIELLMDEYQPDGTYHLDPAIVAAPVL